MTAEEMKLKCMVIAGKIADLYDLADYPEESDMASAANRACLSVVNSIAAIPVEADPRDAQITALREALEIAEAWVKEYLIDNEDIPAEAERVQEALAKIAAALAVTKPKGDAK